MKKYLLVCLLSLTNIGYASSSYQDQVQQFVDWTRANPIHVICFIAGAGGVYALDDFMMEEYPVLRKLIYAASGGLLCATYGPIILASYGVSAPDMPKS